MPVGVDRPTIGGGLGAARSAPALPGVGWSARRPMATSRTGVDGRRGSRWRKVAARILLAGWLVLGMWAVVVALDTRERARQQEEVEQERQHRAREARLLRTSCGGITSSECPAVDSDDADAQPCYSGQVKANLRSMIYHLPESGWYASTTADVRCFNNPEDAEVVGFRPARGSPGSPRAAWAESGGMTRSVPPSAGWSATNPALLMVLASTVAWLLLSLWWKAGLPDFGAVARWRPQRGQLQTLARSGAGWTLGLVAVLIECAFVLAMMPVIFFLVATPFGAIFVPLWIVATLGLRTTLAIVAGIALCVLGLVAYAWWSDRRVGPTPHEWATDGHCTKCGVLDVVPRCLHSHGPAYDVDAMDEDNPYGIVPHCENSPCRPSRRVT